MSSLDQMSSTPVPAQGATTVTRPFPRPPDPRVATASTTSTTGVAQTADGSAPFTHMTDPPAPGMSPAVAEVMARKASDTPAQHKERVAGALASVQDDVARTDEARRQEILAGGDTVTAQAVVLGGSTMGTLDAATLPFDDVLGV